MYTMFSTVPLPFSSSCFVISIVRVSRSIPGVLLQVSTCLSSNLQLAFVIVGSSSVIVDSKEDKSLFVESADLFVNVWKIII